MSVARAECGDAADAGLSCPNRGCRAPEVAAGALFKQLEAAFEKSLARLTISWRPVLSADQWATYAAEFSKGKSHIVYIITLKTSHWQQLPWALCVLGHYDEEVARSGSRSILRQFATCPDAGANHRLTMSVCSPNANLGRQLRNFARGAGRDTLPELFTSCAGFAGIPITERFTKVSSLCRLEFQSDPKFAICVMCFVLHQFPVIVLCGAGGLGFWGGADLEGD